jgi:metallo-beta-lactamase family protein
MQLTFHGGAGTVTGSCFLIEHARGRFLIDCGLFQGPKSVRELNYRPFPFPPEDIDFLLLTHAHIDHIGLVPKLCKHGFAGPIHATAPTIDLASFMLPDSGHIQEMEVERLNRRNRTRGRDEVSPIYTRADAEACLGQMRGLGYEAWFEPGPGVRARFWNAGHILGSASIELQVSEAEGEAPVHLLFSGDLGPDEKVFYFEPEAPAGFDDIICESTYGDRDRAEVTVEERRAILCKEIKDALAAGGNLVIPAFAVERTQELLHDIGVLLHEEKIPSAPVFLDSPLANHATEVFVKYAATLEDIALDEAELFRNPNFRFVESVDESKAINRISGGAIIIAASGMCEAGRIRHHLKHNLWRAGATVLMVGYQAPGTLGHLLLNGEPAVRIQGEEIAVKARIRRIDTYSAHADQKELVAWVRERLPVHAGIFLSHGEDQARAELRSHLIAAGCEAALIQLPKLDESFRLTAAKRPARRRVLHRVEGEQLTEDWHNDYARLLLGLRRTLEGLSDDTARRDLLGRLRAQLATAADQRAGA